LRSLAGERKRGHCNVCDTKHVLFTSDEWVRAGVCCLCGSQARHRILAAAFQYHPDLGYPRTLYKKVVLHIAPEQALQNHISWPRAIISGAIFSRRTRTLKRST
jgi:hypothetical protein